VTVGASFLSQTLALQDSTTVKFEIWDTAGQERCMYASLAPLYYRGAAVAVVVYDITTAVDAASSRCLLNLQSFALAATCFLAPSCSLVNSRTLICHVATDSSHHCLDSGPLSPTSTISGTHRFLHDNSNGSTVAYSSRVPIFAKSLRGFLEHLLSRSSGD
ncbi:hypothetical protein GW17_00022478, partial [Ensete ventricosum]